MALQEHHIHGRKGPNANRKDNVMMICPNCHTNIHTGNILVEGWFMTSEGRMLIWRKRGDLPITGQEASPHVY